MEFEVLHVYSSIAKKLHFIPVGGEANLLSVGVDPAVSKHFELGPVHQDPDLNFTLLVW